MARRAEVFVRRVRSKERVWLRSLRRGGAEFASAVTVRRAQVVSMSGRGYAASEIAEALEATADWVRRVIHEFNAVGLEALLPVWGGGRPREITDEMRARIVEIVDTHPQELGEPYACWSLSSLRSFLLRAGVVARISKERLREILIEEGHTTQATKGWKTSPDPDFDAKAARLRRLYRAAERGRLDGVLLCFDVHGPVTPTPKAGRGWLARGRPRPIRANYRKPHGVAFFFGVYDVGADQLFGRWFPRKGADNVITILKLARRRYPAQRIWIIQDNPVLPLDPGGARLGEGVAHHAGGHAHLRVVAEPDRVPVPRAGQGGLRRLRLPQPRRDPGRHRRLAATTQRRGPPRPGGPPAGTRRARRTAARRAAARRAAARRLAAA